jgi:hypothetical protein
MKNPSSEERGKRIARAVNILDLENDHCMHFALDMSFDKINAVKNKAKKDMTE